MRTADGEIKLNKHGKPIIYRPYKPRPKKVKEGDENDLTSAVVSKKRKLKLFGDVKQEKDY